MFKYLIGMTVFIVASNSVIAAECGIKLGGGGANSSVIKLKNNKVTKVNNIGGPWDFIRYTYGPCHFELYNESNFEGRRKASYGSDIGNRNSRTNKESLRVGAIGGKNKNGWKVRSLIITPTKNQCQINLRESGGRGFTGPMTTRSQTFHGPARVSNVTGWSYVASVTKNCQYTIYNGNNFSGKSKVVDRPFNPGWKISSIKIDRANEVVIARRGRPKFHEIKHIKGRCLDISGGINQNETNVQIYQCNNSKSQKWQWTKTGQIKNIMGRCLDISGLDVTNNSNVEIYQCGSGRTQQWEKISNNRIQNSTGFCLDIANGVNTNKTNVQLYRCKNVDAQQWK